MIIKVITTVDVMHANGCNHDVRPRLRDHLKCPLEIGIQAQELLQLTVCDSTIRNPLRIDPMQLDLRGRNCKGPGR